MTDAAHKQSDDPSLYLKEELYQQIRENPEIFDFIQEGSLDGVWYWDIENPLNEWLSPRLKEVFGYEDHEIPNTSEWWQKNIFPEDLKVAFENFEKHSKDSNHPYDQVVRYRHKDGSTVWVRCRGIAIRDKTGKPIRLLGAHTDVTDLKKAEEALVSHSKLAALGEMAAGIAHEINNPLQRIKTQISLIERLLLNPEIDRERIQKKLLGLDSTVDTIGKIVKGLKAISRTGLEDDTIPYLIDEIIDDTVSLCQEKFQKHDIKIQIDEFRKNLKVLCREYQINQVLLNLINNAIDVIQDLPQKTIKIKVVEDADIVKIKVIDSGWGISKEVEEKIFKAFFTTKEVGKGTGLGLSVSKKLVESNSGSLYVDHTEPNTCFVIELPKCSD